ncbi:glycosyltransferase family 17 protein [Daedalea quercina L-15889]|uniref:Glycosyltransferase family 17 protein n=1 Tax=Daedalea quercina L-15889 TaxID=1314783 RepID=A0A165P432_9APHY|nr:glycosyltransferase family 17 protein [Daedalea quercina L-15889]
MADYVVLPPPAVNSARRPFPFFRNVRVRRHARFCLLLGLVATIAIFILSSGTVVRDLGYLLRPVWDTPPKPFQVIPHYDHPNVSASDLCDLHGWHMRQNTVKIWDATIFSVELDLLEIRLRELYDIVDHFVIVESSSTFTGLPKPLHFAENRERFAWAADKILYRAVSLPPNPDGPGHADGTWQNEARSRREINDILRGQGVQPGDLVIQADVDEIPSFRTIELIRACEGYPSVLHLKLRDFMYSFVRMLPEVENGGSWRASVKTWNPAGPGNTGYSHGRQSDVILADAGWHCSWCFKYLEDFRFKMKSYSHYDRVTRPERQLDPSEIQRKICEGKDVFDMYPEAYTFDSLYRLLGPFPLTQSYIQLPWWAVQNAERFDYLLRQDRCRRRLSPAGDNSDSN